MAGILAVTGTAELHAEFKAWFEKMGFGEVDITSKKNDVLNMVICNKKPRLVIIDIWFYRDGTARRIGELLKLFPKLNVAVVSLHDFPLSNALWFIWEGAKSYLHTAEGMPSHAVLRVYLRPNWGSVVYIENDGLHPHQQFVCCFSCSQPFQNGSTCLGNGIGGFEGQFSCTTGKRNVGATGRFLNGLYCPFTL